MGFHGISSVFYMEFDVFFFLMGFIFLKWDLLVVKVFFEKNGI